VAVLRRALAWQQLAARCADREAILANAALPDPFAGRRQWRHLGASRIAAPAPCGRAAAGGADKGSVGVRSVAAASLSVIRALAREGPLIVAIDDRTQARDGLEAGLEAFVSLGGVFGRSGHAPSSRRSGTAPLDRAS
jgi:hypothetical protein